MGTVLFPERLGWADMRRAQTHAQKRMESLGDKQKRVLELAYSEGYPRAVERCS